MIINKKVYDKEFLEFIKNKTSHNVNYDLIFKILPDIINFLYWIHKTKTGPLCFISRDGYFLKILYDKLFPNEETYYVYCSRKALYNSSRDYVRYMKQFYDLKANWVDIDGSNRSHYSFFKRNFGKIPIKYIFLYDAPFLRTHNEINVKWYTHNHDINLTRLIREISYYGMGKIENLFRANHRSIIDVKFENNDFIPIFESIYDTKKEEYTFNKYVKHLFNDYKILEKLIRPNMFLFREEPLIRENYRKKDKKVNGVIALDLDHTTDCPKIMNNISSAIKHIKKFNYEIVIITARLNPMEINLDSMGLSEGCDIYYNTNRYNPSLTKALQLERAHKLAGLSDNERYKSFLIDNCKNNINSIKEYGFSGILTNCNIFQKDIMNIFPNKIKNYQNQSKHFKTGENYKYNYNPPNNYYNRPKPKYNNKLCKLDDWD